MKIFAMRLYKWYKTAQYIAVFAFLSVYDVAPLASIIGMAAIAYMLTRSLRTYSVVDPTPIYGV